MINRRQFIKGILALTVVPAIPFVCVEEIVQPNELVLFDEDNLIKLIEAMKYDVARKPIIHVNESLAKMIKDRGMWDDERYEIY